MEKIKNVKLSLEYKELFLTYALRITKSFVVWNRSAHLSRCIPETAIARLVFRDFLEASLCVAKKARDRDWTKGTVKRRPLRRIVSIWPRLNVRGPKLRVINCRLRVAINPSGVCHTT